MDEMSVLMSSRGRAVDRGVQQMAEGIAHDYGIPIEEALARLERALTEPVQPLATFGP